MKPGIQTTEFWLTVVANVLTQTGALGVPDRYRWVVMLGTLVGYALSRGLAKTNPVAVDFEPDWLGAPQAPPAAPAPAAPPPAPPAPAPPAPGVAS